MKSFTRRFTLCVALATVMTTAAQAGQIKAVNWFSGVASVAGTVFPDPFPSPGNDNVVGTSPNEIHVTQKHYTGIGPVDLVFDVVDDAGVTEYFIREGVDNSTGLTWTGYHLELGFGIGAGFTKSTLGDGLDFDDDDDSPVFFNPSPGFFTTFSKPTEDDIIAGGGSMPTTSFAGDFIFHVDVPNGITEFTLRQSPLVDTGHGSVPEPSTLGLAVFGLLWMRRVVRRRPRVNQWPLKSLSGGRSAQ